MTHFSEGVSGTEYMATMQTDVSQNLWECTNFVHSIGWIAPIDSMHVDVDVSDSSNGCGPGVTWGPSRKCACTNEVNQIVWLDFRNNPF